MSHDSGAAQAGSTVTESDWHSLAWNLNLNLKILPTNCHVSPSSSESSVTGRPRVTVPVTVVPDAGESARDSDGRGAGQSE